MADVRSMLRAERENRRITHPYASYAGGQLLCNLCGTNVKSEKAWGAHLHSTQHNLRQARERDVAEIRETPKTNKKRKAVEFEESPIVERKKARPEDEPEVEQTDNIVEEEEDVDTTVIHHDDESADPAELAAELEALERDIAALEEQEKQARRAETLVSATISAPAMTAEESQKLLEDAGTAQRSQRDIEAEEDREDATRALEDEFEEMQTLQDRVQKLKRQREALRDVAETIDAVNTDSSTNDVVDTVVAEKEDKAEEADEESDEDEDEDDWNFGAR